jgi:hypothetical protein
MHEYQSILRLNIKWNWKNITLLAFLAIFPNIFGLFHTELFGVRIHFFQYLIFLAALIYGPIGGIISASFGSIYTAIALNNPYVIIGNIILGFFFGLFIRLKWGALKSLLTAYAIQLPWLIITDIYFANMPKSAVGAIVIALLISNIIWAFLAKATILLNNPKHNPDIERN